MSGRGTPDLRQACAGPRVRLWRVRGVVEGMTAAAARLRTGREAMQLRTNHLSKLRRGHQVRAYERTQKPSMLTPDSKVTGEERGEKTAKGVWRKSGS